MGAYTSLLRRVGHERWAAALGRALVPVDRAILGLTGARWMVIGRPDLPHLVLATTGRSSGMRRRQPLLYALDGDAFVVAGSNWGLPQHPAWTANLLADPRARITVDRREIRVDATLLHGADRERAWRLMLGVWPAYAAYERRSGRRVRVFRLRMTT